MLTESRQGSSLGAAAAPLLAAAAFAFSGCGKDERTGMPVAADTNTLGALGQVSALATSNSPTSPTAASVATNTMPLSLRWTNAIQTLNQVVVPNDRWRQGGEILLDKDQRAKVLEAFSVPAASQVRLVGKVVTVREYDTPALEVRVVGEKEQTLGRMVYLPYAPKPVPDLWQDYHYFARRQAVQAALLDFVDRNFDALIAEVSAADSKMRNSPALRSGFSEVLLGSSRPVIVVESKADFKLPRELVSAQLTLVHPYYELDRPRRLAQIQIRKVDANKYSIDVGMGEDPLYQWKRGAGALEK
jgi:hypothetical protein